MRILPLLVVLAMAGCASPSVDDELGYEGFTPHGENEPTVSEFLAELKKNPEAEFRLSQGWTIVEIPSEHILYSFTPSSHEAHPSYAKRAVIQIKDSIHIETSASCGAKKEICDSLVRSFLELNENIKHEIGKN